MIGAEIAASLAPISKQLERNSSVRHRDRIRASTPPDWTSHQRSSYVVKVVGSEVRRALQFFDVKLGDESKG